MSNKLLVISGLTATSKTSLAIYLAKKFNGEIVSADSRQVYKKLDIGTGKDISKIKKARINVWGYDLVEPKKSFSVGQYIKFARKMISDIQKRGKLPILVGGTGLYIKGVVDGIPTAFVPKNNALRKNLMNKSTTELFEILAQMDSIKAASLNTSDRKNPRRLVRAIEVATYKLSGRGFKFRQPTYDSLFVGLLSSESNLSKKIDLRVIKRLKQGLEKEVRVLVTSGVKWESQAMTSLGYRHWREYFEGKTSKKNTIDLWKSEEKRYAKRQLVWFKKDKRINWFDSSARGFKKDVENMVKKWHNMPDAKKD
ncbi:tRNA (adenosine(37)-N6)-dimethylallyltransferase MiaA [Patescibacteria group bacterium]